MITIGFDALGQSLDVERGFILYASVNIENYKLRNKIVVTD